MKQNNQEEFWHKDPRNWKWGLFYINPDDPRIFVPKRVPIMGVTLNFAHAKAWLALLLLLSPAMLLIAYAALASN